MGVFFIICNQKQTVMLIKASPKYIDYIYFSAHYLNCPTHMFNHALDCFYRQAKGLNNGKAVEWIAEYLKNMMFLNL